MFGECQTIVSLGLTVKLAPDRLCSKTVFISTAPKNITYCRMSLSFVAAVFEPLVLQTTFIVLEWHGFFFFFFYHAQ